MQKHFNLGLWKRGAYKIQILEKLKSIGIHHVCRIHHVCSIEKKVMTQDGKVMVGRGFFSLTGPCVIDPEELNMKLPVKLTAKNSYII